MAYDSNSTHPIGSAIVRSNGTNVPAEDLAEQIEWVYATDDASSVQSLSLPNTFEVRVRDGDGMVSVFAYDSDASGSHDGVNTLVDTDGRKFILRVIYAAETDVGDLADISANIDNINSVADNLSDIQTAVDALTVDPADWPTKPTRDIEAEPSVNPSGLSITATGTRWAFGPDGTLRPTQAGTLRDDYDPVTGEYLGKLIEAEARTNLLTYSQDFSAWTAVNVTVMDFAAVSWTGAQTAATLIENSSTGFHSVQLAATTATGIEHCIWAVVSPSGRTRVRIAGHPSSAAWSTHPALIADLSAGTATVVSGHRGGIEPLDNDTFLIWCTGTPSSASNGMSVGPLDAVSTGSYLGDGTSGIIVHAAQLEAGSYPTSYIPTHGATATRAAESVSEAILGYTGGPEGTAGTNLVPFPEAFDNVAWTKNNATVTANSVAAPLGAGTVADTLTDDATNGLHQVVDGVTITGGSTFVISAFAKPNTLSRVQLRAGQGSNFLRATIDLSTGGVVFADNGGSSAFHSAGAIQYPDGWWRVFAIGKLGASDTAPDLNIRCDNGVGTSYSGSGQSLYIWGAKAEEGSALTPYNADDAGHWFNPDEGTVLAEVGTPYGNADDFRRFVSLSDGSTNNRLVLSAINSNSFWSGGSGGSGIFDLAGASQQALTGGNIAKTSLAYAQDDFAASAAGVGVGTDSAGNVPTGIDLLQFGAREGGLVPQAIHLRRFAYFPKRMANADLQTLTRG